MTVTTEFLVDRETAQRTAIHDQTLAQTLAAWERLENLDAEAEVDNFLSQLFPIVETAQVLTGNVTASYVTSMIGLATGQSMVPVPIAAAAVTRLRPTPLAVVYRRPVVVAATALAAGATIVVARKLARDRLLRLVEDDLGMAHRSAAVTSFSGDGRVIGYRRVVHPELQRSGVCGLCIAASDQRYRKDELMPLHTRCNCTVAPIVRRASGKVSDPGRVLNGKSVTALYGDALAENGENPNSYALKAVRFSVHQHGELGPVLRRAGDHFQGPTDVLTKDAA